MDDLETIGLADVFGTIAEDLHSTRCAQVCFTGTEDDQAEQHDHGTIGEVLGDPDMEREGDAPEEADREADPPEQIPLLGHPESRPCTFNHEVGIDVFKIIDSVGMRSSTLDAVCMGVTYVQVWVERKSDCGSPSFHTRLQASAYGWSRQTGWPRLVRCDRRTHDRGVFSSTPIKNGVMIRSAGLETPEQISRIERRGDMFKKMMTTVIKDMHASFSANACQVIEQRHANPSFHGI